MKVLLIDDEAVARRRLKKMLELEGVLPDHIREAESAKQAIQLLHLQPADILFLDIEMPQLSGFDLLDLLPNPRPFVVFVTAYDQFALRAFEYAAFDYLTKPVETDRLKNLLERLKKSTGQEEELKRLKEFVQISKDDSAERLFWKSNKNTVKNTVRGAQKIIETKDIPFIEARNGQAWILLNKEEFWRDESLDDLENRLQSYGFIRIHRSYLINKAFASETRQFLLGEQTIVLKDRTQLPVSRRKWPEIKKLLASP